MAAFLDCLRSELGDMTNALQISNISRHVYCDVGRHVNVTCVHLPELEMVVALPLIRF